MTKKTKLNVRFWKIYTQYLWPNYKVICDESTIKANHVSYYDHELGTNKDIVNSYTVDVNIFIYESSGHLKDSIKQKQEFNTKKQAQEFLKGIYFEHVVKYLKKALVLYDTNTKLLLEAFKKYDNCFYLFNSVSHTKIKNFLKFHKLVFKTKREEHSFLMKYIKGFYNIDSHQFDKEYKYNPKNIKK